MASNFECWIGQIVMTFILIIQFFLWIAISFLVPIGGPLGDLFFRLSMGKNLKKEPYTYLISMIPLIGPIISAFIIRAI
jgi:hypothetical protein